MESEREGKREGERREGGRRGIKEKRNHET